MIKDIDSNYSKYDVNLLDLIILSVVNQNAKVSRCFQSSLNPLINPPISLYCNCSLSQFFTHHFFALDTG